MLARRAQVLLLAAAVVVGAAGCGRDGAGVTPVSPDSSTTAAATTAADPIGVTEIPAAERVAAPALTGTALDGGTLDPADRRGKVVVVNAWASWCAPCREEMPRLRATYDETPRAQVAFVGIDVNDDAADAQAFAAETGMAWPSLSDPDGAVLATLPGVPPRALPVTVVLDRQGRVAATIVGAVPADTLTPLVERLVAEPS